jgi:hypothetical protein
MAMNEAPAQLPDRVRLSLQFDPARLLADLEQLRGVEWIDHFVTQNYDGNWSAIPLRAQTGVTHPILMVYSNPAATVFEDTPFLERMPYVRRVLAEFACPLQCVRLMRLAPGSLIKEHRDDDLAVEFGTARLHIPIATNPDVDFRLNGRRVVMDAGSTWYLRLSDPHGVANRGIGDRVHLVIDAVANGWLRAALKRAARSHLPT